MEFRFPFFHGKITRRTCEELLSKKKRNGSYLIRESESVEGALCLCVLAKQICLVILCRYGLACHICLPQYSAQAYEKSCDFQFASVVFANVHFVIVMYYVHNIFHSFEDLIYTYRIFREHQGHFRIQTSEGVPERIFKTLKDLIYAFEKPNQGLITNLRYPVKKPKALQRSQRFKSGMDGIYDEADDSGDYVTVLP